LNEKYKYIKKMSEEDEDSLSFYLKNKENKEDNKEEINESEIEKDKKEEEEIFNRYEKIGNLTDIKSIKESDLTKNYDEQGNKYYNEYKVLQELGCGAYSKVKLVMKDNIKYAMKIIDKKELKKKKIFKQDKDGNIIVTNLLKDALKEIAILKKLDHPNIIKLYEILHNYQKEKIYLIMEYAEYGDIVEYDEDSGIFSINKHVSDSYNKNKDTEKIKSLLLEKNIIRKKI
jgi:[calcium/calmodulin-dependent protein kinase] kinase